jgi:DNA invertase Pin-like site-specific DNA recombinase
MRALESRVSNAKCAALYIRVSTEHQDYYVANQTAALERYAEDNKMVWLSDSLISAEAA